MQYALHMTFTAFFNLLNALLIIRALMSWFVRQDSRIYQILVNVTEPIIMPTRWLCRKLNVPDNLPIDIPYLLSFVTLNILQTIVWVIIG